LGVIGNRDVPQNTVAVLTGCQFNFDQPVSRQIDFNGAFGTQVQFVGCNFNTHQGPLHFLTYYSPGPYFTSGAGFLGCGFRTGGMNQLCFDRWEDVTFRDCTFTDHRVSAYVRLTDVYKFNPDYTMSSVPVLPGSRIFEGKNFLMTYGKMPE